MHDCPYLVLTASHHEVHNVRVVSYRAVRNQVARLCWALDSAEPLEPVDEVVGRDFSV
jgi:hypothetical protein